MRIPKKTASWANHVPRFSRAALIIGGPAAITSVVNVVADYKQAVTADGPVVYQRFNDSTARSNINVNDGSLGAAGNATNLNVRSFPSAIVGSQKRGTFYDQTARAIVPFQAALNPDNTKPFTVELWAYPSSDQINGGQAIVNNRYAYSGVNRQGWVIFQRSPNDSYIGKPGHEGIGWNFRMYRGSGGSTGLDIVSDVPYQVGKWTHIVAVYDPVTANESSLSIYIDGELAKTQEWNNPDAVGYAANTDDHGAEAVNGPAGLAFGAYNNTAISGGQTSQSNPYFGGVSDFALYGKKLSAETIRAHYQNGTNAARATAYATLVQSESPVEYLTLGDAAPTRDTLINLGELRNAGDLTVNNKVQRQAPTPLAAEASDASLGVHRRAGGGTRANIPFKAENNPTEDVPLSVEFWVRPQNDRLTPGAAVINNRKASGNRSGWVIFQRAPNATYSGQSGFEGIGYNFRMYTGSGGSAGADLATKVPYTVGEWQHVVFTWEPSFDTGNGNWNGTLRGYVNGSPLYPSGEEFFPMEVTGNYHANTDPTDGGTPAADLAIGSYNAASNWGQEFDGDVDEVAIYKNYILTPEQVAAHYEAGTNSHPATNYSSLVFSAPYQGAFDLGNPTAQRTGPATYLRFNDPATFPAANSGSAGWRGAGTLQNTINNVPGPSAAGYPGFEATNTAAPFDGTTSWVSINAASVLDFTGAITLEAWVRPAATQGERARIISHGPSLLSLYGDGVVETNGSVFTSPEVFLQIDNTGANYTVGSSDGTTAFSATAPVPASDLTSGQWVHLAGTYDGTNWRLYRNGALLATSPSAVGALPVPNGDWAIGSAGEGWEQLFTGDIDEPAIYNKALTGAQIKAHFDAATSLPEVTLSVLAQTAGTITFSWTGGSGKFLLQKKADIGAANWINVLTTTEHSATVAKDGLAGFFRVQSEYTGADVLPLTAYLTGDAEKPTAVTTAAKGVGTLSLQGTKLDFLVSYNGLSSTPSAAHIHGSATVDSTTSAGVMVGFPTPVGSSGYISGSVTLTDAQRDNVLAGRSYVNIHTANFGGGEIRGNVLRTQYTTVMNGANERPTPVVTTATGAARIDIIGNELTYNVNWTGLSGTATAGHIHGRADATTASGVLQGFTGVSGATGGTTATVVVGQNVLGAILDGKAYVNIHTALNGGGEIRGQLAP